MANSYDPDCKSSKFFCPLSMEFSRQEHWSGLPFPSPGDLHDSGIKPGSALQADSLQIEPPGKPQFTNFLQPIYATENFRFYIFAFRIFKCLEFIFIGISLQLWILHN